MKINSIQLFFVVNCNRKKDVNKNLNQVMKFQFSEIWQCAAVWLIIKSNYPARNHHI